VIRGWSVLVVLLTFAARSDLPTFRAAIAASSAFVLSASHGSGFSSLWSPKLSLA
jgi:hypothetical protein